MLQNARKALGFKKNIVFEIPPGEGGAKPYPASGLQLSTVAQQEHVKILLFKMLYISIKKVVDLKSLSLHYKTTSA